MAEPKKGTYDPKKGGKLEPTTKAKPPPPPRPKKQVTTAQASSRSLVACSELGAPAQVAR